MARLPRFCPAGVPQHLIQRGNNRQVCFDGDEDFSAYAYWLEEYSRKFCVDIHAWVFMTNHAHLLATPKTEGGISLLMQALGRRYVRYFNFTYQRTGTLWEGRFKSSLVQSENYLLNCQRYIELNPVRANMVADPADYVWSSYQCNGLGVSTKLCTPHSEYLRPGKTKAERQDSYRKLFLTRMDSNTLKSVRDAINTGMALGSDQFKIEIETLHGRRVKPASLGRPPSKWV